MEISKLSGAFNKATVRLLDGSGALQQPSLPPAGRHRDSAEALCLPGGEGLKGPCCATSRRIRAVPRPAQAFAECAEEREAAVQRLLERKVDGRLACLLLELAGRFGEEGGRGKDLRMRLSHQDLSCMVACTREASPGHGRAQGGRSHRDAEAMPRRRAGRASPEQGGDGTADNGTGRVRGDASEFSGTRALASS